MPSCRLWAFALALLLPASSFAQVGKEATVIFKDGFHISGRVIEKKDYLVDPASGAIFHIPSAKGYMYLFDEVRRCLFTPTQVQEVVEKKLFPDLVMLKRPVNRSVGYSVLPSWQLEKFSDINEKGDRVAYWATGLGTKLLQIPQKMQILTPHHLQLDAIGYGWSQGYFTPEFGYDAVRKMATDWFKDKKDIKDADKRIQIAKFLHQAGYSEAAEKDLTDALADFPERKEDIETLRDSLKKVLLEKFVGELERAHKVGNHQIAQDRLRTLYGSGLFKQISAKSQLTALDIKTRYETNNDKVDQVRSHLRHLTERVPDKDRKYWTDIAFTISEEITLDNVERLDAFHVYAQQLLRDLGEGRQPSQSLEEVFALAISGWTQGKSGAETDVKTARSLWKTRLAVLESLLSDNGVVRSQHVKDVQDEFGSNPDIIARMMAFLPPTKPYNREKLGTETFKVDVDLPDATGAYHVKLPPGYHHFKPFPVLVLLHGAREKPEMLMSRWAEEAASNGYILVAPIWGTGLQPKCEFSTSQHGRVTDCIRDIRRRFNVDSDRLFLFGWEQGAELAYDVGLGHPSLFAGVMPMCGSPRIFAPRYWANGQYLHFYAVDGDRNGGNAKRHRELHKDWMKSHYPALYVEYMGRLSEWFSGEVPLLMEWMNHKKRANPVKALGTYHTSGGVGEEFKSFRECDNRFYWIGSDNINERNLQDADNWISGRAPAMFQASIHTGNELAVKGKDEVGAKIWNQVNLRVSGMKSVTVWLAPGMVDFTKPIQFRVNGAQYGQTKTHAPNLQHMLEEVYQTGDRQRLYYLRLDLKL